MDALTAVRDGLTAAMVGDGGPQEAADRLCAACVELLLVDGAAISLALGGAGNGTFGSSGDLSRRVEELQFTYGEGPCLDAVRTGAPVHAPDLTEASEVRWPAFSRAAGDAGVGAIFALPVAIAARWVGALDLVREERGPLTAVSWKGGLFAAELAAHPVLELLQADELGDDAPADPAAGADGHWPRLAGLGRVEVYQATGMVMAALDISEEAALVRLRAHAFAHGMTASEVAWEIVERRLRLDADGDGRAPDGRTSR